MVQRPMVRYHGGKWRMAPWIISHFPQHEVYCEPYGGGASVLLRKQRTYAEIYNDLDGEIVNLFAVARDRGAELAQACELTPYARAEFDDSFQPSGDPLEQARRTVIRSYFGFGGNLTRLTKKGELERTGFRDYSKKKRRSIPAHDWRSWPQHLQGIIERLRGVIIEKRNAVDVLQKHDGPETLHFVDPPYVQSTRFTGAAKFKAGYRHEMNDCQHRELADVLRGLSGNVLVCGYASALYERLYKGWRRVDYATYADGARPRMECLWISPS